MVWGREFETGTGIQGLVFFGFVLILVTVVWELLRLDGSSARRGQVIDSRSMICRYMFHGR